MSLWLEVFPAVQAKGSLRRLELPGQSLRVTGAALDTALEIREGGHECLVLRSERSAKRACWEP